jgi:hypothetical protein
MPATTITTPATSGAITQASPSRPRYGPSVPTLVVGFKPGGRNCTRFLATGEVSQAAVWVRILREVVQTTTAPPSTTSSAPVT